MKFRCERDVLADACTADEPATSRTGRCPCSKGFSSVSSVTNCAVTGTDLDMTIRLAVTVG